MAKFVKRSDRVLSRANAKYTNLYVKNLDTDITEEALWEKFSDFGKITSLIIMKNENGISRGFGFINFDSPDDAKQAAETMNGSKLGRSHFYLRTYIYMYVYHPDKLIRSFTTDCGTSIGSKFLYVARAQKRAERDEILRQQFEDKRKERIFKCKVEFQSGHFCCFLCR